MASFCLIPEYVDKFKAGLRDGSINPEKLSQMTSEQRNKYLSDVVGKDNATNVNSLFESKLLLKNQKAGYIAWAKKVAGLSPQARRDLISKIERMDRILSPQEGEQFLKDLAETRLGVGVSEVEAKQIFDLSEEVKKTRSLQQEDFTFKTEDERLAYGRSKVALTNYVNDLKEQNNLGIELNPAKALNSLAGNAKSIKSSMDNSAIFRQGWKTLFTNPNIWQKNARKTFSDIYKTFGGKKVMDEINADIISRPTFDLMQKAKLAVGNIEEAFPGTVAEKLPVLGRAYKASENAYTGFLYRTRADIFDKYIDIAKKTGVDLTNNELENIGKVINSLTGRGDAKIFNAPAINNLFFSPRFIKAQVDTLTHPLGYDLASGKLTSFARKQATMNLLKVVTGNAAILAIANAVKPGSVEMDSRSADFGKIKIGNTRFDVSGGMSGLITLASRLMTQSSKSSTTGNVTPLNSGKFGAQTGTDVLYNFFENKLSPVAGVIKSLLDQENFDGEKPTPGSIIKDLFLPIGASTYEDLKKDPNSPNHLVTMLLDGLGIGANTYLPKPAKENSWLDSPTKSQAAFKNKVGEDKFKEANSVFNLRYTEWQKQVENNDTYKKLDADKRNGVNNSARERIQDQVFKDYGFDYKESPKTRDDLREEQELEKIKPRKISESLMNILVPPAAASGGEVSDETRDNIVDKIVNAVRSLFGAKEPVAKASQDPNKIKLTTTVSPDFVNENNPGGTPSAKTENFIKNLPTEKQAAAKESVPLVEQAFRDAGVTDPKVLAYALSTIETETSGSFKSVREGFYNDSKYGYEEGFTGKSSAKKLNYSGGENYYGRGFLQLTHDYNYKRYGEIIGEDLVGNPDLALEPTIAAKILVAYFKARGTTDLAKQGKFEEARRTINADGKDKMIAERANKYLKLLTAK